MNAIEMIDVRRSYAAAGDGAGAVEALRGVSLTIGAGELVAVVGPSGSGKSTLLHLAGALERPSAGTVRVLGDDLRALDDGALTRLRRDRIGFVFQSFHLLPTLTAVENVMLPSLLAGERQSTARRHAEARLAAVGLESRRSHRPHQLSGGEMQRVAIARALLRNPPLILADEPTGNLDTQTGEEVLRALIQEGHARTVIIVTHDATIAARADRVIRIRDGRIESPGVA